MSEEDAQRPETESKPSSPHLLALATLVIGLIVGSLATLGVAAVARGDDDSSSEGRLSSSASDYEDVADDGSEDKWTPPAYQPTTDDFAVEVSVKQQQCFGSAGCNVTLGLLPSYRCSQTPTDDFEITYEIQGVEDGPLIQTFTLSGDQLSFTDEASAQTSKAGARITAKITRVVADL